jgi:hypothetical protein
MGYKFKEKFSTELSVEGERGWGNLFSSIKEKAVAATNALKKAGSAAGSALSNLSNTATQKVAAAVKKAKDGSVNLASKAKNMLGCLFGKCKDKKDDKNKKSSNKNGGTNDTAADSNLNEIFGGDGKDPDDDTAKLETKNNSNQTQKTNTTAPPTNITQAELDKLLSEGGNITTSDFGGNSTYITEEYTIITTETIITTGEEPKPKTEFSIPKKKVQGDIDPRYNLLRLEDDFMNGDNSVRFVATDTTDLDTYTVKLYLKGTPTDGKFYNQNDDSSFKDSLDDCRNHKIVMNRLYNKPATNVNPINYKTETPIYTDIKLPACVTQKDSGGLKTDYLNIFTMADGERLDKKCLKGLELSKGNTCLPYLRLIVNGVLHAIKLYNMGNVFFKHGNIGLQNIFLLMKNDAEYVFLDNMLYDSTKYDDINNKPFKHDFNQLGDALIQLITGTHEPIIQEPLKSTFDLYHQIKTYFEINNLNVNINSAALNMGNLGKDSGGKPMTKSEYEYKLQKSVFNFIYRLKCTGINPANQFQDIDQALNHDFIKAAQQTGPDSPGEKWDTLPSDF